MVKCPYCKSELKQPPKRTKKCPSCGNRVHALPDGRYVTETEHAQYAQAKARDHREKQHRAYRAQVLSELREARRSGLVVGIQILASDDSCPYCKRMHGQTISLDSAIMNERLRPPFDQCTNEVCTCTYTEVLASLPSSPQRARSGVATGRHTRSGCLVLVVVGFLLLPSLVLLLG